MKAVSFAICLLASPIAAQSPPAPVASSASSAAPNFAFSGVLFGNFQYRGDELGKSANRFEVERAYLTFQTSVRERLAVRVTTDLFQQTNPDSDDFYSGWVIRAKYAYLQYRFRLHAGSQGWVRAGLLQTVFIEHDEKTWPRWISTSPTERAGYFSSADAGVSASAALPARLGELYATVTNGPGYTSREVDRFKDYAARLTLTPWASDSASRLRGVAFSVWGYKGATASRFVAGGTGQAGAIGSGLARDRFGVHVSAAGPKFSAAAQYARRVEQAESGSNTPVSPRSVTDSTGVLMSAYLIMRPFSWSGAKSPPPLSFIGRLDRVVSSRESDATYNVVIGGLIWDLSKNVSVSLDYQETTPVRTNPVMPVKTYFAHLVARY